VATFYKASELLGTGRYSEVYRAFDTDSQTDVALKVYSAFSIVAHDRANKEASLLRKLGALNSQYFPALRRSGKLRIKNQNHPLLVLELGSYVDEEDQKRVISLKDVIPHVDTGATSADISGGFWTISALVRWMLHLLQAVKQLHSMAVVHRDIKPANILLKRGPGQSEAVPFVLDYNSASDLRESDSGSGTPRYLPPEVKLGRRVTPSPEDDLWAVAMVAWELLFGQGATPDQQRPHLSNIDGVVPGDLGISLARALSLNPEFRYRSADEFIVALEACVPDETPGALTLRNDDVASARAEMDRIRQLIGQVFAPPGQIIVPKDIDDAVNTIFAWLSHEDSQALNLVDEIVKLGSAAIPACLQQGYRLHSKASSYDDVVVALGELAAIDRPLAERSVDAYALSSNRGVRELCWRVCEALEYFPEILLTNLTSDEGLLLPQERLGLAELCIRFSGEATAVPALVKYMCREYVLDKGRYHEIRDKVATRMHEVQGDNTARAIWDACHASVWTELTDFDQLPASTKPDMEGGLIELLADAFVATADAGLHVLKATKPQWYLGVHRVPMFRRFAVKAGRRNMEVRTWLLAEANQSPEDSTLKRIADELTQQRRENRDDPKALLREYLKHGDKTVYNALRFLKDEQLFEHLDSHLSGRCSSSDLDLIVNLLRGFQHRHRARVVELLLNHWSKLSAHNYRTSAELLSAYPVPSGPRERAIEVLNRDLNGVQRVSARRALELLLK
jgi:serine/threonine protein kinase